jgi:2-oxopent-4-enoate/cis-2-oxohex-4-enoate hydratase
MKTELVNEYGDELYDALRARRTVEPLTNREQEITIDDAYRISRRLLDRRLGSGEKVIGKKTGVTSKVVQAALGVHQPDFGYLTDVMLFQNGADVPVSTTLIQPRAEGEIAFFLEKDLTGPGVTSEDVLAATAYVKPCFEIVDSRIRDWKIKICDTIADNASSGVFLVGDDAVDPRTVDFVTCGMVVWKNGEVISTGAGAAAVGTPVGCVAWLANTLGAWGIPLKAGEVILSGSLVPLEPVRAGDVMEVRVGGIGSARARFV